MRLWAAASLSHLFLIIGHHFQEQVGPDAVIGRGQGQSPRDWKGVNCSPAPHSPKWNPIREGALSLRMSSRGPSDEQGKGFMLPSDTVKRVRLMGNPEEAAEVP